MPVVAYKPRMKTRLIESEKAAKSRGIDLSDRQLGWCLIFGVGGPVVMVAGALYLIVLSKMGRLVLSTKSETDVPGLEVGVGIAMLSLGAFSGIAGGFFYCETMKTRRTKLEREKTKERRSSRLKLAVNPMQTIEESSELGDVETFPRPGGSDGSGRKSKNRRRSSIEDSQSELHTYPFSSMETISTLHGESEIPPNYSSLFPILSETEKD